MRFDAAPVDCAGLAAAGDENDPCCPSLGLDACAPDLICGFLDGREVPLCVSKGTGDLLCTGDEQCLPSLVCRLDEAGAPHCQRPAGSVERGGYCSDESDCASGLDCVATDCGPGNCKQCVPNDGSCVSDDECAPANGPDGTVFARCTFDVGGSCRSATPANEGDEGTCAYAVSGACDACGDATCTDTGIGFVACGEGPVCVGEFVP